jgi:hypothetical protein
VLLVEETEERLDLEILVHLRHVDLQRELLHAILVVLGLDPQQTQQHITTQITVAFPSCFGVGETLVFLDLETDDLGIGLLLPVGVVVEDGLFQFGDVVVEQLCEVEDYIEQGHGNAFTVVVQDYEGFGLLHVGEV